jgi:hypothetical protein
MADLCPDFAELPVPLALPPAPGADLHGVKDNTGIEKEPWPDAAPREPPSSAGGPGYAIRFRGAEVGDVRLLRVRCPQAVEDVSEHLIVRRPRPGGAQGLFVDVDCGEPTGPDDLLDLGPLVFGALSVSRNALLSLPLAGKLVRFFVAMLPARRTVAFGVLGVLAACATGPSGGLVVESEEGGPVVATPVVATACPNFRISGAYATFELACGQANLSNVAVSGSCATSDASSSNYMVGPTSLDIGSPSPGDCHVSFTFATGAVYGADVTFTLQWASEPPGCPSNSYIGPTQDVLVVNNCPDAGLDGGMEAASDASADAGVASDAWTNAVPDAGLDGAADAEAGE